MQSIMVAEGRVEATPPLVGSFRRWRSFLFIVALPGLLASLYFGLIASDIYVSESRFVVRSAEKPDQPSGLDGLFKGFVGDQQSDLLFVRDYLLSHQVAAELDRALDLRSVYGQADLFARFPGPFERHTLESFYPYYKDRVKVGVDPSSSVGALTVQGFSPDLVTRLDRALLGKAARRVDELNEQIRRDTSAQAEHELARAVADLGRTEDDIAAYRRTHAVIDPDQQAAVELQGGQELAGRLVAAQSQLAQIQRVAPQSSQVPALQTQVATIQRSLDQLRSTVSSGASTSRAQTSEAFRALVARRDIATKIVAAATEARIRARADAERRHIYLEVVSQPSVPDEALLPHRFRSILGTWILALICWGGFSLLWSGVREHRDHL